MKKIIITVTAVLMLSGCYHQSAIPLGNDMMEIDVSAAPVYGRAGAMDMATKKAAQATIDAGYDKFIVVNNNGWSEMVAGGGSYSSFNANPNYASGASGSGFSIMQKPEVKMVIHMFHDGDKGSAKAVDARSVLNQQKPTN